MFDPDHNDDAKNAHRQHRPDKPLSAPAPSAFWRKQLFEGESIQLPCVKVGPFLGGVQGAGASQPSPCADQEPRGSPWAPLRILAFSASRGTKARSHQPTHKEF